MRITILAVPDCPNLPLIQERITAALDGRPARLETIEVGEEDEAARLGMAGSPTILLDGVDPFARPGALPSVSCRLYRDPDGRAEGAPTVRALRRALAGGGDGCCEPDRADVLDPIGRAGRGRRAPAERGLRAVHQAVLLHLATTGHAPDPAALEAAAATAGRTAAEVLAELDREDFLTLDPAGRISAAYPFSATPTRHRVRSADGVQVWSMCAIDALGIRAMLGRDVTISSTDPVTGEPVTVTFTGGVPTWEPATTVVYVGRRAGEGPAAAVCCDALNFFTGPASAEQWQRNHPEFHGEIVGRTRAVELAEQTFGPLLRDSGHAAFAAPASSAPIAASTDGSTR
ncbi:alkylmercury lyase family protein [Streptomyces sp. NPDC048337]|uniref:alkylmercury lyase family protein n=1 Tax=Streptomyces sp. NPDC048337 TaxID=3365535 RepID=UPI00371603C9